MSRRCARGFTLLEVMVALAIVSIGLIAAFNGIIQMAHSTATLRERAMADWIAMNEITAIRISGDYPAVGRFDGSTEFAGREWRWEANISETGVNDLRRIDMIVSDERSPDDAITIMTGFMSRGAGVPTARIDWWGLGAGPGPGGSPGTDPDADDEPVADEPVRDRPPRRRARDRGTPEDDEE
jgi:general secretion pathway protein I